MRQCIIYSMSDAIRFTVMFLSLFFCLFSSFLPIHNIGLNSVTYSSVYVIPNTHKMQSPRKWANRVKKEIHSFYKASLKPLHILKTQFVEFCYSFAIFTLVSFDTFTASFGYLSLNVVSFSKAII